MNKNTIVGALLLGGLSTSAWIAGCTGGPADTSRADSVGEARFALEVAPGLTLSTVTYTISGSAGFSRMGSIDVSHSSTLSAIISDLPIGVGFEIVLRGTTVDGRAVCMGSAPFDIDGPGTKVVPVHVTCDEKAQSGSVMVAGSLNTCPRIDGIDVTPAEVAVGGTIALAGTVVDPDSGPSALGFTWTATSGTLAGASTPSATFTCTKVGMATVTLAASDGDPACSSQISVDVVCSEPQANSPIKHVIVLIGENRSFDHAFGTYVPRAGQTVSNLLSKGIVNADGSPGPSFALSAR